MIVYTADQILRHIFLTFLLNLDPTQWPWGSLSYTGLPNSEQRLQTEEQRVQRYKGTVGTEEQRVQRYRGTVGTADQWEQRISGYRETEVQGNSGNRGTEEQWVQSYRGTVGTVEQWVQRNSRYRGTVGTKEQRNTGHSGTAVKWDKTNTKVVIYRIQARQNNLPILRLKFRIF